MPPEVNSGSTCKDARSPAGLPHFLCGNTALPGRRLTAFKVYDLEQKRHLSGSQSRGFNPASNEPETQVQKFVGFHGEAGTPGSIPNPEVKRLIADDTAYFYVGT